jgi:hypothetical protein
MLLIVSSRNKTAGKHIMPDKRRQPHQDYRFWTRKGMGSKEETSGSFRNTGIRSSGSRKL